MLVYLYADRKSEDLAKLRQNSSLLSAAHLRLIIILRYIIHSFLRRWQPLFFCAESVDSPLGLEKFFSVYPSFPFHQNQRFICSALILFNLQPLPAPPNREFQNATFLSHPWKPPGSELLSSVTCFHTTTFKLLSIFLLVEMIPLEIWETTVLACEMFTSGFRSHSKTSLA